MKELARALAKQGISAVPLIGKTEHLVRWGTYTLRTPTNAEIDDWWNDPANIAILTGKVWCVDFDTKVWEHAYTAFIDLLEERGDGGILDGLVIQRTPSGGRHIFGRTDTPSPYPRNQKLALAEDGRAFIETRGSGGLAVVAPSDGYAVEQGRLDAIPCVSVEVRESIFAACRALTRSVPPMARELRPVVAAGTDGHAPGDEYDQRGDVQTLLQNHGWTSKTGRYWTRPGKREGISATLGVIPGRFYVFSTSAVPFESQHVYRPWHVFAMLECGGDFHAAAKKLKDDGYGMPPPKRDILGVVIEKPPPPQMKTGARAFSISDPPPPTPPVLWIGNTPIGSRGNLCMVTSQAKSGKSAFLGGIMGAMLAGGASSATDCLGVTGEPNPDGNRLIHIDTEQSQSDHHLTICRVLRRAGLQQPPPWFASFSVRGLSAAAQIELLENELRTTAATGKGVLAVVIDGVADLLMDVNDAGEANALIARMEAWATVHSCLVVGVLHENPYAETAKMRGHLGSQAERKAETVLRLERRKDDDLTDIYTSRARKAPIGKGRGPVIGWDEVKEMHVLIQPPAGVASGRLDHIVSAVFGQGQRLTYGELVRAVQNVDACGQSAAQERIHRLVTRGLIRPEMGVYLRA